MTLFMAKKLYQVDLPNICAGIIIDENYFIIKAAPVLSKFLGQHIDNLYHWVALRGTVYPIGNWYK